MNKKLKNISDFDPKFIYWVDENLKRFYDIYFEKNSVLMYWVLTENLKTFLDKYM